ncbi:sigma-70 family RNA polymerase sigma factor [Asticcacaulis sp.]|jgi:RNA polymerase sigma-70 factor (ECF subfamily)|uniref:sigma-70 family RNA polymerase sigma factor n=1 Tax=Asticcacaulis sp. TaxID=1872648 RepID=UPI003918D611
MRLNNRVTNIHIGTRLKARRLELGMSIEQLTGALGISALEWQGIETGERRIGHMRLLAAAAVLKVSERHLYQGLDGESPVQVLSSSSALSSSSYWVRDVDRWFAEFVVVHERSYLRLARRMMGDVEAARDLLHDAYANVLDGEGWRSIENPRAYVMRTIFNLGVHRIRRARVVAFQALPDFETLEFAASEPDGFQAVAMREQLKVGLAALNGLPDMTRRVLIMRRLEGMAVKVIARRLGMTVKGVDYHIARGAYLFSKAVEAAGLEGLGPLAQGGVVGTPRALRRSSRDSD